MKGQILFFTIIGALLLAGCQTQNNTRISQASISQPDADSATSLPESGPGVPSPGEDSAVEEDLWENDGGVHLLEDREQQLSGDVVEIRERLFVAQTDDIYLNPDDYFGRTIHYEGFYATYDDQAAGETYHYVARNGPGCCANDTLVGFEILYGGELPSLDDWCEVTGQIEILEEVNVLVLRVQSLKVLDERGVDTVYA